MRVRSLLLGACMVVVPLLAMFSHHLPPQAVAEARDWLWRSVAGWAGWAESGAPPSAGGAAAGTLPPVDGRSTSAGNSVADVAPGAASSALSAVPTADPPQPAGRLTIEDRLRRLGAGSIECQPLQGGGETILASCRVAVDPSGELQRVFQAAGPDATAALGQLVADVEAWRHRTAVPAR